MNKKSSSRFLGKKLISNLENFEPSLEKYYEREDFEDFIINIDQNGDNVYASYNYYGLDPLEFRKNIFFKREVLRKYYDNPQKYQVEDNYLRCKSLWGLPIDNNHSKYIIVYLGNLGLHLSQTEQLYWKSFNIPPDGELSKTTQKRDLYGQFAKPERSDLLFTYKFNLFSHIWKSKFKWPLFLPLKAEDQHYFNSLHIPLSNNYLEFERQVISLTKITTESLNQKEMKK